MTGERIKSQHYCGDDVHVEVAMETGEGHLPLDRLKNVLVAGGEEAVRSEKCPAADATPGGAVVTF